LPPFSGVPFLPTLLRGAHEETAVDRILTLQERIRARLVLMQRDRVPLAELEARIAEMATQGVEILMEGIDDNRRRR
jgi:hypothetical protein